MIGKRFFENGEETKNRILELLKRHKEGLSVQEISSELKINRTTVTKYVLVLEAVEKIIRRKIGSATLHYLKSTYKKGVGNL